MHRNVVSLMAFSGALFLLHGDGRARGEAKALRDEPSAAKARSEQDHKKTNDPDEHRKADGSPKSEVPAESEARGKKTAGAGSDAKKTAATEQSPKKTDAASIQSKTVEKDPAAKKPNHAGEKSGSGGKGAPAWTKGKPGVVKLVRGSETLEVRVLDRRQHLVPATLPQFARFLRSKSGADHPIDARLVTLVATVSDHFGGREVNVVSGFRPFSPGQHSRHSNHNEGRAIDFSIKGIANETVRDYCRSLAKVGVGYYPNSLFVHLDVRDSNAYWVDYAAPGQAPRYRAPDAKDDDDDEGDGIASVDGGQGAPPVRLNETVRDDVARGKNGRGGDGDVTGPRGVFVTR